jgi:hypothetical protein
MFTIDPSTGPEQPRQILAKYISFWIRGGGWSIRQLAKAMGITQITCRKYFRIYLEGLPREEAQAVLKDYREHYPPQAGEGAYYGSVAE